MNLDLRKLMAQATEQLRSAVALAQSGRVIDIIGRRAHPPAPPPDGFSRHSFANASDRREYQLFVPPGVTGTRVPLVVMLHGCSQNPDDFAAGTRMNERATADGFVVLYPAQSRRANPQGCWNWFKHSHQTAQRGEPALIAGMVREVMARHAIDPGRVYVAGLSAGGAMAAILGETFPGLFAAVGVHSGLAAGAASDMAGALAAMQQGGSAHRPIGFAGSGKPTIVFHGDADTTVHVANARAVIAACTGKASTDEVTEIAGTRGARREIYRTSQGRVLAELWLVHGSPHAWSGGRNGSYTDPAGPDASGEMLRFFAAHAKQ